MNEIITNSGEKFLCEIIDENNNISNQLELVGDVVSGVFYTKKGDDLITSYDEYFKVLSFDFISGVASVFLDEEKIDGIISDFKTKIEDVIKNDDFGYEDDYSEKCTSALKVKVGDKFYVVFIYFGDNGEAIDILSDYDVIDNEDDQYNDFFVFGAECNDWNLCSVLSELAEDKDVVTDNEQEVIDYFISYLKSVLPEEERLTEKDIEECEKDYTVQEKWTANQYNLHILENGIW